MTTNDAATPDLQTNGAPANGAPDGGALSRPALLQPPTLQEAVSALPLSGSGELTRERLQGLVDAGDVFGVLLGCLDEMDRLPGLVEVLRAVGKACAELPIQTRRDGVDALADYLGDQIGHIAQVLRGALSAMPISRPRPPSRPSQTSPATDTDARRLP